MKRILLLLTLCLGATGLKAQTAEETVAYINAKYGAYKSDVNEWERIATNDALITITSNKYKIERIWWGKVTGIAYTRRTNDEGKQYWRIVLSGKLFKFKKDDAGSMDFQGNRYLYEAEGENGYYFLIPEVSEENVKKFVKALTKIAELNGAKLVKDDLF
ncbi:hypothetical protein [Solitalea koreensis]|uniref:DUF4468 domain-containing protein n=1 Tax=Solitalea koreensis TaxID=543615 RepID=A0A521DPZ7_9SPHI|nr:hypothetical protein [Solitalea koreensis]SMO73763.1 hypothetical protein SAMN06265350_10849 [Solitalea koreensis]